MRSAIHSAVKNRPGVHFRQLQRNIDCSVSTLNYHLSRSDSVKDVKIRGYRRLFPVEVPQEHYSALAALNHKSRGEMVQAIDASPGITSIEVAETVGLAGSTVSAHLKVLVGAELVDCTRAGRKKHYRSTETVSRVVADYAAKILDRSTDNFIGMWG